MDVADENEHENIGCAGGSGSGSSSSSRSSSSDDGGGERPEVKEAAVESDAIADGADAAAGAPDGPPDVKKDKTKWTMEEVRGAVAFAPAGVPPSRV